VNNYELIAGDRSMAILGVRSDISFKIFTEGVISDDSGNVVLNLMQQDAVAMRVVARFGFAVAAPATLNDGRERLPVRRPRQRRLVTRPADDTAHPRGVPGPRDRAPADDLVAQDIVDGEEAWLARRLQGPLEGGRTETFHVGYGRSAGRLSLRRFTDAVTLTDGGAGVASDRYRLIDGGSGVELLEPNQPWWTGPYVTATYEPNDEDEIRRALFDLVALAATPVERHSSESIGAYAYSGGGASSRAASRAVIVASLIPKRDPLVSLAAVSRGSRSRTR
jgi:hypothetical protein